MSQIFAALQGEFQISSNRWSFHLVTHNNFLHIDLLQLGHKLDLECGDGKEIHHAHQTSTFFSMTHDGSSFILCVILLAIFNNYSTKTVVVS